MGKTILISSHILHELEQLCTRIGIIEQGQMVAQGSLDDIYRQLQIMRLVHVRLIEPTDDLFAKVQQLPGVTSVEEQVNRWAIKLQDSTSAIEDLHKGLVELGARIHMFQPEAMDMETVFMKLTEGKTA